MNLAADGPVGACSSRSRRFDGSGIVPSGVERVAFHEDEPTRRSPVHRHDLTDPLDAADVAVVRYRVEPGGRIAGLHAHGDQEEVFVVHEGRLAFETLDGVVPLPAGEAVRFAPGEHKSATNDADVTADVLAFGAPRGSEEVFVPLTCPNCGHAELRISLGDGDAGLVCPDCETELAPRCPACGGDELSAVLDRNGGHPVSECADCGERFDLDEV